MKFLNNFQLFYNSVKGYRTNKRYIVIESDDWGAERMPSTQTFKLLRSKGVDVTSNPFNRLDTLESDADLEVLLELMESFRSRYSKNIKLTLNFIMGNPDFDKIESSKFTTYKYREFTYSYSSNPKCASVFNKLKVGMEMNLFRPQFHGRDHVNVHHWLRLLNNNNSEVRLAFDNKTYALNLTQDLKNTNLWQALNFAGSEEESYINTYVTEGLLMFSDKFGYQPKSFIAPAAFWKPNVEKCLSENGVNFIQSFVIQHTTNQTGQLAKRYHYCGQMNDIGMTYLVRNCFFEPSTDQNFDWVSSCLKQIERAFFFNRPAIISMHRLNFVGGIEEGNRETSLSKFNKLLTGIMRKWPDAVFISTDELGGLVAGK